MRRIAAVLAVLLLSVRVAQAAPPKEAPRPVDLALVLVDDVSGSINDDEFALQKKGYVSAFDDPKVIAAITGGTVGAIAVAYVEFAGDYQVRTVLDWQIIHDANSSKAFAAALGEAERSFRGHTAISAGIDRAMQLLAHADVRADRRVIDVCGDGTNNAGRDVVDARRDALRAGVTINGLAIANESDVPWLEAHTHPPGGLANYYRQNVTGGPGSFVLEIHDYRSFATAIARKLINEIARRRASPPPVRPG